MTTIVWDGTCLAADSQMTIDQGSISQEPFQKIYPLTGKFIDPLTGDEDTLLAMAGAGDAALLLPFRKWLLTGMQGDLPFDVEDVAVVVVCQKSTWQFYGSIHPIQVLNSVTIGSGGTFAQSALSLGFNAPEAVAHAIKHDVYSGGRIVCMNFDKEGPYTLEVYDPTIGLENRSRAASLNWV